MKLLRARIQDGHIVPDEPSGLPEGTVVNIAVLDEGNDLEESEREALNATIRASHASLRSGEAIAAEDVLRELDSLG